MTETSCPKVSGQSDIGFLAAPSPARRLLWLGIDGQPGLRTTPCPSASVGFDNSRDGRCHEQLSYCNVKDVSDFPKALVRNAYLSPFHADNRPSVHTRLKAECFLGEIFRKTDFPDPCSHLITAFLPSLKSSC